MSSNLKSLSLLLGFCILGNLSLAQSIYEADDSKIQYVGRIDFSNPKEPTFIYPSVSIKAKFNGTSVSAKIYDYGTGSINNTNYYKVLIDNEIVTEQLKMLTGENTYLLAESLTEDEHTIELIKITEGASGKSSFRGFLITGSLEVLVQADPLPNKKIEFIGDSWTCGYGNLSQYATGNASMEHSGYVAQNEDNYYSWAPITARAIGAQYHVTATSGRGLYRNNTGSEDNTLPKNYNNTLEDNSSVIYDHNSFHPDVISIHLGTNDLAQEEGGEQFKLDDDAFKSTYIDFIDKLLLLHPCVNIIICYGNSKSDSWPTWTKQLTRLESIANEVSSRYYGGNVTTLKLPYTAEKWTGNPEDDCGYGDAWHPTICSHKAMSEVLINKINSMNIIWGESGCIPNTTFDSILNDLKFYPNPSSNYLKIANWNANDSWIIFNPLGQTQLEGQSTFIDLSKLENGLYFINVVTNGVITKTVKLVKK